jgi:adenylosuccinate synthase
MPGIVIVGVQWGDEGKGKATDLLGDRTSRSTTTPLPMTAFTPGERMPEGSRCRAYFSSPMTTVCPALLPPLNLTTHLEVLFAEIEALNARGLDTSRLKISANAHVITQYHRTLDKVTLDLLAQDVLVEEVLDADADAVDLVGVGRADAAPGRADLLVKVFNRRAITVDEIVDDLLGYVERLRPMVCDTGRGGSVRRPIRSTPHRRWPTTT